MKIDSILLHPAYFGPISQYIAMANAKEIVFENEDSYQKQTYRTRMYIYGANGKLLLNIPIKHTGKGRQMYKDVKIENDFGWQQLHWKSMQSAYRSSPFFEFFEDDLQPLYDKQFKYLLDFNYECFEAVSECMQADFQFQKTEEYFQNPKQQKDLRFLINAKQEVKIEHYPQVFEDKKGFLSDLSILDLLFNEGTNAFNYLENHPLDFIPQV